MIEPYYSEKNITIYLGDCREILSELPRVDLVLTDPPYGIGFAAQPTKWQRQAGKQPVDWDDCTVDSDFLLSVIGHGDKAIIWGGNYYSLPLSRCWLSWCKPDAPPSMGNVEFAWTNLDDNSRYLVHSISATNKERVGHPTQKPLRVMTWALLVAGLSAGTVLDPYCGSGTTLLASKKLGLSAIGIEISREYCDIAIERLKQDVFDFTEPLPEPIEQESLFA